MNTYTAMNRATTTVTNHTTTVTNHTNTVTNHANTVTNQARVTVEPGINRRDDEHDNAREKAAGAATCRNRNGQLSQKKRYLNRWQAAVGATQAGQPAHPPTHPPACAWPTSRIAPTCAPR